MNIKDVLEPNQLKLYELFETGNIFKRPEVCDILKIPEKIFLQRKSKTNRKIKPFGFTIEKTDKYKNNSYYKLKKTVYDGKGDVMTIDVSLNNKVLYAGCDIEEVAGRLNLKTPMKEAVNIVGRNVATIVKEARGKELEVILTGGMAIPIYLVIFHAVVHAFNKVWYDDGRSEKLLIAAHG